MGYLRNEPEVASERTARRPRRAARLAGAVLAAFVALALPSATASGQAAGGTTIERYDLAQAETAGGHTLSRHVGRTDAQLRDRLTRERNISAASTYTDRDTAERVIAKALAQAKRRVDNWVARTGSHPNLALDYAGTPGDVIGRTLVRGESKTRPCTDAVVVLRWQARGQDYVLTSYPEQKR